MAKNIFQPATKQELLDRISRLRADNQRRFGKMTAPEMVCHLKDSLDVATGVTTAKSKDSAMANPLVRWLVLYVIPWPKGKAQTVPEMLVTRPGDWSSDLGRLQELLATAAARGSNASWGAHPAFGTMSGKLYARLIYKHFDHHLKQFGV
jgi:hypothetical protein